MENRAPEFFAGVRQRRDHERAGTKWADSLGVLIKASAGHGSIVVWEGGKLQTDLVFPWRSATSGGQYFTIMRDADSTQTICMKPFRSGVKGQTSKSP